MDEKPKIPARPGDKTPETPPHITTIREVKGIHVLDHKDDAIHPGPTGTRDMARSVTSL